MSFIIVLVYICILSFLLCDKVLFKAMCIISEVSWKKFLKIVLIKKYFMKDV